MSVPPLLLRVAQSGDSSTPSAGMVTREPGIGVVRGQSRTLVLVIVVHGQLPAGGVGQLEHRIQRRVQPAGMDFRDDLPRRARP